MPDFVVEHRDGRVFSAQAEDAGTALADIARRRRLNPMHLRAMPRPKPEHEWGIPFFLILCAGFALNGVLLLLV